MPTVGSHERHAEGATQAPAAPAPRSRALKHALDRVAAAAGLLVTAPLILAVALVLRARGGPVLRREARIGEGGRELTLLTFATAGELWGLAAVPQLWNVLRGDMSIVGPRPRTAGAEPPPARPGLTGLAQAEQLRRPVAAPEQLALDDEYARCWRPGLDARIVARTVLRFLP